MLLICSDKKHSIYKKL